MYTQITLFHIICAVTGDQTEQFVYLRPDWLKQIKQIFVGSFVRCFCCYHHVNLERQSRQQIDDKR